MKYLLIAYGLIVLVFTVYNLYTKTNFFKWIWYSITYKRELRILKDNLSSLSETPKLLAIIEWLDADLWYKKCWFGRKALKVITDELDKLKNNP